MFIGWDIGIKNLCYCIIEKSNETDNDINKIKFNDAYYIIKEWKIINIASQVSKNIDGKLCVNSIDIPKCNADIRGNKKCSKNSLYCKLNNNNGYSGLCLTHYKKYGGGEILPKTDKRAKCFFYKKDGLKIEYCSKKPKYALKDHHFIRYCSIHKKKIVKDGHKTDDDFIELLLSRNVAKINLTNLGIALYEKLDENPSILKNDIILLENQPVLKNPTMKSVQMFLYSYYLLRGIKDIEEDNDKVKEIKCYMANKKTELINFIDVDVKENIKERISGIKGNYQKNKKTSIYLTQEILKDNKDLLNFFNNNKKKDDLADAILMTLHYIIKNTK